MTFSPLNTVRPADIAPRRCVSCLRTWCETDAHRADPCPFCGDRRPLLFLDVDGVLNTPTTGELVHVPMGGRVWLPVWLPAGAARRVQRLLDIFEPVWATCWREHAHPAFAPLLGIDGPAWPHLAFEVGANKLPEIIRVADRRPCAWVDDDIEWELRRLEVDPLECPILLVEPDPREGLTDEHVERLLAWAAEARA